MNDAIPTFVREERYIVVKVKHLTDAHARFLRNWLDLIGVQSITAVVVEEAWPEYEPVWAMLEQRMTGVTVNAPTDPSASIDDLAARMAKADGLDWHEVCGYETDRDDCDSGTCIASHYEDHDPDWARNQYRRYARVALAVPEPVPVRSPDAPATKRFDVGDFVSHNAGLIEGHTKRQITTVLGYERNGGVQYRLALPDGRDQGMAYDCELDAWPGNDVVLPLPSPRNAEVG